jgi:hypothetical protein
MGSAILLRGSGRSQQLTLHWHPAGFVREAAQRLRLVFLRSQKPLFSKGSQASTKALSTLTNQYFRIA